VLTVATMLKLKEAAARLRLGTRTVATMLKEGRFAGVAVKLGAGSGRWRFDADRLEAWIAGNLEASSSSDQGKATS
jgi:excisionase family DNA binding protein